jgi:hypothetical protein
MGKDSGKELNFATAPALCRSWYRMEYHLISQFRKAVSWLYHSEPVEMANGNGAWRNQGLLADILNYLGFFNGNMRVGFSLMATGSKCEKTSR